MNSIRRQWQKLEGSDKKEKKKAMTQAHSHSDTIRVDSYPCPTELNHTLILQHSIHIVHIAHTRTHTHTLTLTLTVTRAGETRHDFMKP